MKGQINLSYLIIGGVGLLFSIFGGVTAINNRTDDKLGTVQKEVAIVSERTAKLETSVPAMQSDIRDIKDSIRKIEGYLRPIR